VLRHLIFFLPTVCFASETAASALPSGSYIQVGFALLFIIALLLGAAWLAKKVSGGKGFGQGGLKVIGGVSLGPRERIVLLEVGDERLVVGIVPGQIRTLHRLSTPSDDASEAAPEEKPFKHWLQTITEQRKHE
jgi:flagellar protein FliO/FliZ